MIKFRIVSQAFYCQQTFFSEAQISLFMFTMIKFVNDSV